MKHHISDYYNALLEYYLHCIKRGVKHKVHQVQKKLECGPMPNVMAALSNISRRSGQAVKFCQD